LAGYFGSDCRRDGERRYKTWHGAGGKYHRLYGPAYQYWYGNEAFDTQWYHNGELHRANGKPAVITHGGGDTIVREWYENGRRHRTVGPAVIVEDAFGMRYHQWHRDGIQTGRDYVTVSSGMTVVRGANTHHVYYRQPMGLQFNIDMDLASGVVVDEDEFTLMIKLKNPAMILNALETGNGPLVIEKGAYTRLKSHDTVTAQGNVHALTSKPLSCTYITDQTGRVTQFEYSLQTNVQSFHIVIRDPELLRTHLKPTKLEPLEVPELGFAIQIEKFPKEVVKSMQQHMRAP